MKSRYVVTHLPSMYRINCEPMKLANARKLGRLLAETKIPWGRIKTPKGAAKYYKRLTPEINKLRRKTV